jgi:hypothetical protein
VALTLQERKKVFQRQTTRKCSVIVMVLADNINIIILEDEIRTQGLLHIKASIRKSPPDLSFPHVCNLLGVTLCISCDSLLVLVHRSTLVVLCHVPLLRHGITVYAWISSVIPAGTLRHMSYLTYFLDVQSSGKLIVEREPKGACLSVCLPIRLSDKPSTESKTLSALASSVGLTRALAHFDNVPSSTQHALTATTTQSQESTHDVATYLQTQGT